jgi:hypothetical protein
MKPYILLAACTLFLTGCKKEKDETTETVIEKEAASPALAFTTETHQKKSSLPCKETCTNVSIEIPVAENIPVVADSINNKIFNTVRGIVYFGEKPYDGKTYDEIMASFISAYDKMKKDFPKDPMMPWEATIKSSVPYKTDSIINIKLTSYMFTGGAHGYGAERSLLFDAQTGKSLKYADIFTDIKGFTAYAEKKFRETVKIPAGKNINSTGFLFENDKFALPQNIFFTDKGLVLYYNSYEIASYADQQKEVLLPYSDIEKYLKVK